MFPENSKIIYQVMSATQYLKLVCRAGRMESSYSLAEKQGFEVFLTIDRGIEYEQNLQHRSIAVILIRSKSSRLDDLLPTVLETVRALGSIQPGQLLRVG